MSPRHGRQRPEHILHRGSPAHGLFGRAPKRPAPPAPAPLAATIPFAGLQQHPLHFPAFTPAVVAGAPPARAAPSSLPASEKLDKDHFRRVRLHHLDGRAPRRFSRPAPHCRFVCVPHPPAPGTSPWPSIDAFNKSDAGEQSPSRRSSPGPSLGTVLSSPLPFPAQDPPSYGSLSSSRCLGSPLSLSPGSSRSLSLAFSVPSLPPLLAVPLLLSLPRLPTTTPPDLFSFAEAQPRRSSTRRRMGVGALAEAVAAVAPVTSAAVTILSPPAPSPPAPSSPRRRGFPSAGCRSRGWSEEAPSRPPLVAAPPGGTGFRPRFEALQLGLPPASPTQPPSEGNFPSGSSPPPQVTA